VDASFPCDPHGELETVCQLFFISFFPEKEAPLFLVRCISAINAFFWRKMGFGPRFSFSFFSHAHIRLRPFLLDFLSSPYLFFSFGVLARPICAFFSSFLANGSARTGVSRLRSPLDTSEGIVLLLFFPFRRRRLRLSFLSFAFFFFFPL